MSDDKPKSIRRVGDGEIPKSRTVKRFIDEDDIKEKRHQGISKIKRGVTSEFKIVDGAMISRKANSEEIPDGCSVGEEDVIPQTRKPYTAEEIESLSDENRFSFYLANMMRGDHPNESCDAAAKEFNIEQADITESYRPELIDHGMREGVSKESMTFEITDENIDDDIEDSELDSLDKEHLAKHGLSPNFFKSAWHSLFVDGESLESSYAIESILKTKKIEENLKQRMEDGICSPTFWSPHRHRLMCRIIS